MHEQPFPFWLSKNVTTYTELQQFCEERYRTEGPWLIRETSAILEAYQQAEDVEVLQILRKLDDLSLTLSCFNTEWIDFSVAVFEVFVLPTKASTMVAKLYLKDLFNSTLRRIANDTGTH